jgi:hypothetical protein
MSTHYKMVTKVENNGVYQGFDLRAVKRCTPEIFGLKACAELIAEGDGQVIINLTAESPLGNFTKTFSFNADADFEFKPIPRITIKVSVANFKVTDAEISFKLTLKGCIDVPFLGEKCDEISFDIELPMPLAFESNNVEELSSGDMALLLLANNHSCTCK